MSPRSPRAPVLKRVLVTGASAAMVQSTLKRLASNGAALAIAMRDAEKGASLAAELGALGAASAVVLSFDASSEGAGARVVAESVEALGGLDAVLVAHGALTDQARLETNDEALAESLRVNGTSAAAVLMAAARAFEAQGHGTIAAITSGAGERGRRSTYGYGMGKAMLSNCLQGLRARLHRSGITVLTIVPCFVDTPMTAPLPARLRFISADDAGQRIFEALQRGQDTLHIPGWWRLALFAARNAPEWLWKRSRTEEKFAEKLDQRGP